MEGSGILGGDQQLSITGLRLAWGLKVWTDTVDDQAGPRGYRAPLLARLSQISQISQQEQSRRALRHQPHGHMVGECDVLHPGIRPLMGPVGKKAWLMLTGRLSATC